MILKMLLICIQFDDIFSYTGTTFSTIYLFASNILSWKYDGIVEDSSSSPRRYRSLKNAYYSFSHSCTFLALCGAINHRFSPSPSPLPLGWSQFHGIVVRDCHMDAINK
ncbi:hypothetical protein Hdeb2414_s0024g00653561 [Helianthus debilis subsp. tardiflorus]